MSMSEDYDMAEESKSSEAYTLPEGRIINQSVFTKDKYDDKATPAYKVEVAIDNDDPGLDELYNLLLDAVEEKVGPVEEDEVILPLLDGDKMAAKREKKGKEGSAYKGKTVIRLSTIYNADGVDGPGGIQVFDEDAERMPATRQGEMYNGCYGIVGFTIGHYEDDRTGYPAVKLYLAAMQKTKDGEKLMTAADRSTLFKPTGRKPKASGGERQRRRRPRD